MLKASTSALVQIYALTLITADGRLLNLSRFWPLPEIQVADQEYFNTLKSDPRVTSYISLPGRNRANGEWTLFLVRKVMAANGEFLGLVLGAVELSISKSFSAPFRLAKAARSPFIAVTDPADAISASESVHRKNIRGFRRRLGDGDSGTARFRGNPARTSAGRPQARPFPGCRSRPPWTRCRARQLAKANKHSCRRGKSWSFNGRDHDYPDHAQQARAHISPCEVWRWKKQHLDTALNNMSQGLIMFDSAERVVVCNDLYIEMYGLSRETVKPGCSFADLLRYPTEAGELVHRDLEQYHANL